MRTIVYTCLYCGGELRSVATGKILAGRSVSEVLQCSRCHRENVLHVSLSLVAETGDGPRCGTNAGYNRHRSDGQEPCDECRAAHREANTRRTVSA